MIQTIYQIRMHKFLHRVIALGALLAAPGLALCEPLKVAPGEDPGGTAVAVIAQPFALDDAKLKARLAHDGEGVAIGWDFSGEVPDVIAAPNATPQNKVIPPAGESDHLPAAIATVLAESDHLRLIPVFMTLNAPETIGKAIAFTARTPARIVVMPHVNSNKEGWVIFQAAALHFDKLLFVVPAIENDNETDPKPRYPAALNLSNVISITLPGRGVGDSVIARPSDNPTLNGAITFAAQRLAACLTFDDTPATFAKPRALALLAAEQDAPAEKCPSAAANQHD